MTLSPKKRRLSRLLCLVLAGSCLVQASEIPKPVPVADASEDLNWPKTELRIGDFSAVLALPDPANGFYRGARFDHSAMIYRVKNGDLRLFGPWNSNFKRGAPDAVTGPAGEFGMQTPLGYEEALPGETFVKIGVGHLKRSNRDTYSFTKAYEVTDYGKWTITQGKAFLESRHTLAPVREWGYEYRKRIELFAPATIKISYTLKNSGQKTIVTDYYAHNFFVFNDESVAKGDRIEILADLAGRKLYEPARLTPRSIEFDGPILPNRGYFLEMPLPSGLKNPELARIVHKKSGSSLTLSSSYSPEKLVFYAHDKAMCAEPFINIRLQPGEEMTWSDSYQIHSN